MDKKSKKRVLAIASAGGHLTQLLRLRPAFLNAEVAYVTTMKGAIDKSNGEKVYLVNDVSRDSKIGLILLLIRLVFVFIRFRPNVLITTGAAPGVVALVFARKIGIKTLWVDSIANIDDLSLSGQIALKHSDFCLTQWSHLVEKYKNLEYHGGVL